MAAAAADYEESRGSGTAPEPAASKYAAGSLYPLDRAGHDDRTHQGEGNSEQLSDPRHRPPHLDNNS